MTPIVFELDGRRVAYPGDPERTLLDWLREDAGVVAVKDGCSGQGFCRACTVEIDGRAKLACRTALKSLAGRSVTTLAGLPAAVREILADAFVRHGAVQCGFCTPGYLARTRVLLAANPSPTRDEVVAALRHHVCRCTGYHAIVDAVLDAAAVLRGSQPAAPSDPGAVGHSQPRYRGRTRALGEEPFVDDLRFAGLLHGALRLSDHPRAVVRRLDVARAAAMPGVLRILTAADVPGDRFTGLIVRDWPLFVAIGETTRYVGDALAIAVAATAAEARAAATAIAVDYEVLTPIGDPPTALASEVALHPGGNLLERSAVRRGGDVDAALAASAFVSRGTYRTQRVEHAFLEVEAALARPWRDGGVEVFSPGQGVYVDRAQIASLLALPLERVKVDQVAAGGAFGGKEDMSIQGHAALAAHLLQRPVKVKLDRAESIRLHPKRHPLVMEYALGCDAAGRLTALRARITGDTGAYASVGGKVLERAAGHATGAYHVPCVDIEACALYTNNLPCGAMRGFGVNQVTFAMEGSIDDLCAQGGFDRWQFRYDNALAAGRLTATGQVLDASCGVRETLLAVKDAYDRERCVGLACGIKNCGIGNGMADWCEVELVVEAPDRLAVHHGWTEMGQGVHTVAQQMVAEATGLDPALVTVTVSTADGAEAGMTTSSRGSSLVGNALLVAAGDLRRDLAGRGHAGLADLVGRRYRGRWSFDRSTVPGAPGEVVTHYSYSYATQLVVLDDAGAIARVIAAHDAGRVINPALFRGQIQGSVHMGLGYALSEELPQVDAGLPPLQMKDLGLVPMDRTPPIEVIAVEVPDPLGPLGAKGVGEVGLVPTAAAVAGALRAFDGRARYALPLDRPGKSAAGG
ncbi:MAG TPA: selenium-dependent xanthine dehydrogenase [Candidatus Krumholzibacteria bacterium]|nr:selenium-dependent xanthine dehydrogenase [Candidatus Krumholzibacteria bacterium]HPD73194.1 selenium-dependent xanthine dehydrogenase [Candidatus Krumholzibacteria bacterium]HRY41928.1 selenium-dependent xanthine dehydrogenase [Candidatus Krumholzibacteria bacterium]